MRPCAHAVRLDWQDPTDAFLRLARHTGVFWFDSSLQRTGDGRFSVMGCRPSFIFSARHDAWHVRSDGRLVEQGSGGAIARLERLLDERRVLPSPAASWLPFHGGAVGWLSYDLGRQFERLDGTARDDTGVEDVRFSWHEAALVWDHSEHAMWAVALPGEHGADGEIARLCDLLREPPLELTPSGPPAPIDAWSNLSREDYMARVAAVRDGIARGEHYQLNLVQRFSCEQREHPVTTYLRLRAANPSPFSAYLSSGDVCVLSSSPERFLEVSPEGRVRTCPIKGTRPRGVASEDDTRKAQELLGSLKERAELLMIVDLLRNDLGRVCATGTITVDRLHALESFATVHHLVGEVSGQLRPGVGMAGLLRATFPGGSITGAPKVSAMRAIDRLEPHRRGIGMGCLGYFSAHGRADLNIAIRTIVSRNGVAHVPVGAGIVWDSDPAAEYEETLTKARAQFAALGVTVIHGPENTGPEPPVADTRTYVGDHRAIFLQDGDPVLSPGVTMVELPSGTPGVFETLRVHASEPEFWCEHWSRFEAGCRAQGFGPPCSERELATAARQVTSANCIEDGVLRYAAWLQPDGRATWRVEATPPRPHMLKPELRVRAGPLLPAPTPDRAFKHLNRGLWIAALKEARESGYDEVLLRDEAGYVVEGAVSNVFLVQDGTLCTPELGLGALPGVVRAKVLALAQSSGWAVRVGSFTLDVFHAAQEVWLSNSLIGVRPVAQIGDRMLPQARPLLEEMRRMLARAGRS